MPVILLTLTWNPSEPYQPGWSFEISGTSNSIDMSALKFVRVKPGEWELTACQEASLGKYNGATLGKLPMVYVARYLEALEGMCYHVTASHSAVYKCEGHHYPTVVHIWTLKYAPQASSNITA